MLKSTPRTVTDKLYTVYACTLVILFFLSIIIEKGNDVLFINGNYSSASDEFFRSITHLGDGLVFIPIVILALFIRFEYALMCAALTLGNGLLVSIFKRLLFPGMLRPKNVLDNEILHFVPGVDVHGVHSFPSGHTTTAFCIALFLTLITRNQVVGLVTLVIALLVGYSRIYLLQHFLVDVAAGAVIGCFTTYMVWQLFKNANKPQWMSAHLSINIKLNRPEPQKEKVA